MILVFSIFCMHVVLSDLLFLFITVISFFSGYDIHCIHILTGGRYNSPRRINKEVIDTTMLIVPMIILI